MRTVLVSGPIVPDPGIRLPWWWWLAFAACAGIAVADLWAVYRILAGYPVMGGIPWGGR